MIGQQIGHWVIRRKLGAGAYGVVYRAVHKDDDELDVAIKVVQPSLIAEPKFVDALKRECRRLAKLDHRAIVRFRDLVVGDDTVAMIIEYLEGRDLHQLIQGGTVPIDTAVGIIETALEGLAYAHSKGVVHRDIKPSNIYVCSDGRIKLVDFGIAQAAQGSQTTQTGTLKGTFDYMAPERFGAEGGGAHSDIYALGLVAWEMLAGRAACPEGEVAAKVGWHLGVGASDVRTARQDCPGWLAELIVRFVAKAPDDRPADGAAALQMFRAVRVIAPSPAGYRRSDAQVRPAPETVEVSPAALRDAGRPRAGATAPGIDIDDPTSLAPKDPPRGLIVLSPLSWGLIGAIGLVLFLGSWLDGETVFPQEWHKSETVLSDNARQVSLSSKATPLEEPKVTKGDDEMSPKYPRVEAWRKDQREKRREMEAVKGSVSSPDSKAEDAKDAQSRKKVQLKAILRSNCMALGDAELKIHSGHFATVVPGGKRSSNTVSEGEYFFKLVIDEKIVVSGKRTVRSDTTFICTCSDEARCSFSYRD